MIEDKQNIQKIIKASKKVANAYGMELSSDELCKSSYAYFCNKTPHATNFIRVRSDEDVGIVLHYRITTLYDIFVGELFFDYYDDRLQTYPCHVNLFVNDKVVEGRHAEADRVYSQFEWELHLEFDKNQITD